MKAIPYFLAILVAGAAAFFSFSHSGKFQDLQKDRLATIDSNKSITAKADVADKNIKDEKALLVAAQDNQESVTQSVSTLKAAGTTLKSDVSKLDEEMEVQKEEFAQLEKALDEVNQIMKSLGGDVSLENLGEKITEIETSKTEKQKKLEELQTLVGSADKTLASKRAELDRLVTRGIERNARIGRNAMQAVVTAVNQEWGFLVIGAGSNSGFTPQTSLLVERDGRKIGRVRPSSIEPTQTIAEIDLESLASGVRIQPGDRVILATPISN
jgi:predicted RNase H-like nuclease (RuvC/YqgF family)